VAGAGRWPSGFHLGPYEILAPLGAGGMGEVYRARDSKLRREVAIKVLPREFQSDPSRLARFEREAQILASLNHPHIAAIYGLEEFQGIRFLVLELVEGPTLGERIKEGAVPPEEALTVARQIADALEAAHEKGIVHRDLKPANVKIKPDGVVKVLDFGLAKVAAASAGHSQAAAGATLTMGMTETGVIMGTASYMAPEQARGETVDKRADIWAFGVVLYEMLAGRKLFVGATLSDTVAAVLAKEPEWDRVPPQARRLLRRCLEKDAKRRLRDIADAMPLLEDAPAPIQRRSWLAWSAAIVFGVIAAVVSFLHFREQPAASAALVRFQIPVPQNVNLTSAGAFAVSPDGRWLVFSAAGSDSVARLWLRALDSLESRPLAGTESGVTAQLPFWSADSRSIAFAAGGKLKKIDVSGGPAQTVCDLPSDALGGSWNRDGVIIFGSGVSGKVLMRVSEAGGVPTALTALDPSLKDGIHYFPTFLPDGRHFLYLRVGVPEHSGIYVGSLDAKAEEQGTTRLLASEFAAVLAPSPDAGAGARELLFLREGTLMAQPFDTNRLELAGSAVPVAPQVGSFLAYGFFSASTNGVLIYRGGAFSRNAQLTWYDRQGKIINTVGEPGSYYSPSSISLSPDGARVALAMAPSDLLQQDIWLFDFARGVPSRFTLDAARHNAPVWSPNGSRLAFASASSRGHIDLYQKASNTVGDAELLFKSDEEKYPTSWSRDGRFLLFSSTNAKTKSDVWVLPDPEGASGDRKPFPFLHTGSNEDSATFSPDTHWIAYVSDESGRNEVYVQPFSPPSAAGSSAAGVKTTVSKSGGTWPRWSRDGKELFYAGPDGKVMVVAVTTSPMFRAGVPQDLFIAPLNPVAGDVAADGKRFLLAAPVAQSANAPFTVELNWQAGLKK
jgi:Tol biopolymer transport system component